MHGYTHECLKDGKRHSPWANSTEHRTLWPAWGWAAPGDQPPHKWRSWWPIRKEKKEKTTKKQYSYSTPQTQNINNMPKQYEQHDKKRKRKEKENADHEEMREKKSTTKKRKKKSRGRGEQKAEKQKARKRKESRNPRKEAMRRNVLRRWKPEGHTRKKSRIITRRERRFCNWSAISAYTHQWALFRYTSLYLLRKQIHKKE